MKNGSHTTFTLFVKAMVITEGRHIGNTGHEVMLGEDRNMNKVLQAMDINWLKSCILPEPLVKRNLPGTLDDALKTPVLKFGEISFVK